MSMLWNVMRVYTTSQRCPLFLRAMLQVSVDATNLHLSVTEDDLVDLSLWKKCVVAKKA